MTVSKLISNSKIAKDWDLQLSVEPDQIEAKILERPEILVSGAAQAGTQSLENTRILSEIVTEPINFKNWIIFFEQNDTDYASYLEDKMY